MRIRYCAWVCTPVILPSESFLGFRNCGLEPVTPNMGNTEVSRSKPLAHTGTSKHVCEAAKNCAKHVKDNFPGKFTFPACSENPFFMGYEAVMDTYKALDPSEAYYFQSIIGVMRWMVEIVRIEIATDVSLFSSHLAYPREGHIGAALHVMAYLKQKHNSRLVFDTTYPKIDESIFKDCDWKDFYGYVEEAIPKNTPNPRGKDVDLRAKVDSDHAGDKETRRLQIGYLIYCNI